MHELRALSALLEETSISSPSAGGQHRRGSASLDVSKLNRHRRVYSKDLSRWHRNASWIQDVSQPSEFSSAEDEDEDLRQYRQDAEVMLPDVEVTLPGAVKARALTTTGPSITTGTDEVDPTAPLSEAHDAPELDSDGDSNLQADRVAKDLLNTEFDVFLGSSEPPREVVQAVCKCLEEISLSIRSARSIGVLPPVTTATQSTESASPGSFGYPSQQKGRRSGGNQKKRPMGYQGDDDEEFQDDEGEDGFGVAGRNDAGHRKRPKVEQYPCPFRKRSPYKFNCREWEFCAKAPFKTMSELKKHIIKYHQQQHEALAYVCPRCHMGFIRAEEFKAHLMAPRDDVCDVKEGPTPPSEVVGIAPSMIEKLRSRMEHFDWDKLWRALFPDDLDVPDPDFEPVVELHEVNHEYGALLPEFRNSLFSILTTLLPGTDVAHRDLRQRLNDNLDRLFSEFFATTFNRARTHAAGSPTSPQVQRAGTDTPSPAPSQAASVSNSRPPSLAKTTNPRRTILPNPAHRLSTWSSTDTSSSSARYSTSTATTSLGQSNRESMVSDISSQGSLNNNIPQLPPTPIHHHHRLQHSFPSMHAQIPLREPSHSTGPTNPPHRRPRPTTQSPLLQELTLTTTTTTNPPHKRHAEPSPAQPMVMTTTSGAGVRDPHDSAVSDLDLEGCCFKCLGVGDGLCRCAVGGGELPFVGGAAAGYGLGDGARGGHEVYGRDLQGGEGYVFDLEGLGPDGLGEVMLGGRF
ncbi:uncharacterized protein B0H64DRAFT_315335 [Chaetomium fimeti]|uniref:C2H2-type domain-containing protein n=1 Tax=Chaetomium fimeti TaxID=1854472 RepID=A0AAE0LWY1_9PEZI|nr:hypothetical protein B0H64DRAFT_315335 [Chaetomium fimeti]